MSAYVVSLSHVRQMVYLALHGPANRQSAYPGDAWYAPWQARDKSPDELVAMLTEECVRSVEHRYNDDTRDTLPGPIDRYYNEPMRITYAEPRRIATAAEGISLVRCYEYQSCEHPAWRQSDAREFCIALVYALLDTIPEARAEVWSWDER